MTLAPGENTDGLVIRSFDDYLAVFDPDGRIGFAERAVRRAAWERAFIPRPETTPPPRPRVDVLPFNPPVVLFVTA